MGKTTDCFKKIRDTKGLFHVKMGKIKDRNAMDLTEAEEIKQRWQEYTEELYKKDLNDLDNHSGVISNPESDILQCEIRWALGSTVDFPVIAHLVKNLPAIQETPVQFLGQEDPLEKGHVIHSGIPGLSWWLRQ